MRDARLDPVEDADCDELARIARATLALTATEDVLCALGDWAVAAASPAGGSPVDASAALETECGVYAPCALGATMSSDSIPGLRCRIVAGSANNQLAKAEDAELLSSAGILYAPDYVINAGGAIAINYLELNNRTQADVDAALAKIGDTLTEIYECADAEAISTAAAADALAASRLSSWLTSPSRARRRGLRDPRTSRW